MKYPIYILPVSEEYDIVLLVWYGRAVSHCEKCHILVESKAFSQNLEVGQRSLPYKSSFYTKATAFAASIMWC